MRDLYITDDFTRRFTELADKHLDLRKSENVIYLNAGTATHCIAVAEAAGKETIVFGACENEELLHIARDKAAALRSEVEMSKKSFDSDSFDSVVADASLVPPRDTQQLLTEAVRIARPGGNVMLMVPSAGSYGEIFSMLWEVMLGEQESDKKIEIDSLIQAIPTRSALEEMAELAGLENIETHFANEVFEYEDGAAFATSPLVADFLMPEWLEDVSDEKREEVIDSLAKLIDAEELSFRFAVKATVLSGKKSSMN